MYQNYFVSNGEKYYTGTIFIIKYMCKEVEASFICHDIQNNRYIYKIGECRHNVPYKLFWRNFISVTNRTNEKIHMPQTKALRDRDIDGMFFGWLWYIFLMGITTIFNGNVVLWIFISVVFFNWRKKKIQEEGTYIEW